MLMVMLGWVLFRSDSISAAGNYLAAMFGGAPLMDGPAIFWSREMMVPLLCALGECTPILKVKFLAYNWLVAVGYAVQFALFVLSISCLVINAHNPFIYFNF